MMKKRFETAENEFKTYLEGVQLSDLNPRTEQYLHLQSSYYIGMLTAIGKLTVEGKNIEKEELEDALNILTEEIVNTLEL
jgi:GTP-dependent phosphoenolpyruvate carboxykinase